jgi:hypothetical protein
MNSIQITSAEERRLAQLHTQFVAKLQGLPENRRNQVIKATAGNVLGTADPYTRAIARQMKDVLDINQRIRDAQAEIAEIEATDLSGYRPRDPDFKGRMLARKADLEESINADMARALSIREDDLSTARQHAVVHFREADERQARAKAILDAADRFRAEAATRDAEARALEIVNAERLASGKKPLPRDGE